MIIKGGKSQIPNSEFLEYTILDFYGQAGEHNKFFIRFKIFLKIKSNKDI